MKKYIFILIVIIIVIVLIFKNQPTKLQTKIELSNKTNQNNFVIKTPQVSAPTQVVEAVVADTNVFVETNIVGQNNLDMTFAEILNGAPPIPDFDVDGLVNQALDAFRKNLSKEEKMALMSKIETINHPIIMPAIMEALKENDPDILQSAIAAIALMDDPAVIPAVMLALDNQSLEIREDAVSSLLLVKSDQVNEPLLKALQDPNEAVRDEAMTVLMVHAEPYVLPTLQETINYKDIGLQSETVSILEEVPSPQAIDILITSGLLSDYEKIRQETQVVLQDLSGKKFESMSEWQNWWESVSDSCPQNGERIEWEDWWKAYSK